MAPGSLSDFLEHLRAKPVHHRRRIALGTSVGVTAFVAIAWFVAVGASGAFSLSTTTIADAGTLNPMTDAKAAVESTKSNFSNLLGAANAAVGGATTSPSITIVDGGSSSTIDATTTNATNQTSLSF